MQRPFNLTPITVTVAGTRVQCVPSNNYRIVTSILFQADPSNTGIIYVGDSGVTSTNGVALNASQFISVSGDFRRDGAEEFDLTDWYVDASAASQKLRITLIGKK